MIIIRRSIVIFLILLQFVAPLLHAHSDAELSTESIHIPGLERIDTQFTASTSLESLHHQSDGFIVGVCNGINQFYKFVSDPPKGVFLKITLFPSDHENSLPLISYRPEVFCPDPPLIASASRAPPSN